MHFTFFCVLNISLVLSYSELQYIGNELKQQSEVRSNIKDMQIFEVFSYTSHFTHTNQSYNDDITDNNTFPF